MTLRPIFALAPAVATMVVGAIMATAVGAQTAPMPSATNFEVKTTGDLVRLCEAQPVDFTNVAALHFCHGFLVGAYQYHQIASAAENKRPLVCVPNPPPSRNQAVAGFVSWANQNPQQMDTPPVEGMFRYLAQRYPCRA